jgi:hypothetical protein
VIGGRGPWVKLITGAAGIDRGLAFVVMRLLVARRKGIELAYVDAPHRNGDLDVLHEVGHDAPTGAGGWCLTIRVSPGGDAPQRAAAEAVAAELDRIVGTRRGELGALLGELPAPR